MSLDEFGTSLRNPNYEICALSEILARNSLTEFRVFAQKSEWPRSVGLAPDTACLCVPRESQRTGFAVASPTGPRLFCARTVNSAATPLGHTFLLAKTAFRACGRLLLLRPRATRKPASLGACEAARVGFGAVSTCDSLVTLIAGARMIFCLYKNLYFASQR